MSPRISRALLRRLMAEAKASPGAEICGILRGRGGEIRQARAAANVAADPARHFEIDPAALIACHRLARRGGALAVLGYYHSHPNGVATPSQTDAAQAAPDDSLWLIVTGTCARLWRACDGGSMHDRFDPVAFDMMAGNRVHHSLSAVLLREEDERWSVELEYFRD